MTTYDGSCHCGRIRFEVDGEIGKVIECNCSNCRRKGLLLWFVPRASLRLSTPESNMSTYLFNKHVIRHQFCAVCGCEPLAFGRDPKGQETVAVNVRCLPAVDLDTLTRVAYDGASA